MRLRLLLLALSLLLDENASYSIHKIPHNRKGRIERFHKNVNQNCVGPVSVEAKQLFSRDMEKVITTFSNKKYCRRPRFLSKESRNRQSMKLQQEEMELDDRVSSSRTTQYKHRNGNSSFVIQNFENLNLSMFFPGVNAHNRVVRSAILDPLPTVGSDLWDMTPPTVPDIPMTQHKEQEVVTTNAKLSKRALKRQNWKKARLLTGTRSTKNGGPSFQAGGHALVGRITRAWIQNFLHELLTSWMIESPNNLDIQCFPHGNVLAKLCRGYLRCDARVDFDKVVFPGIRLSCGSLEAKRMGLNVLAFRRQKNKSSGNDKRCPRYKNQFDFHANNCTFTQDDLLRSPCIRSGLQKLLVRILKSKGVEPSVCAVRVNSIDILTNGKLACSGEATTRFGATLPFEVSTAVETSSRGHVVNFPGLEISLGSSLGLHVPVVMPIVDLDIGHNAKLRHIHIDGNKKMMTLSASATITPLHTIRLSSYTQSSHSYSALCSVDVGRWITKIGNFAT